MRAVFAAVLSIILAACGGDGAKSPEDDNRLVNACPAIAQAAVVVNFIEDAGGAPAFVFARGTLTDGPYSETMTGSTTASNQTVSSLSGGFARPGTYTVSVSASRTTTSPEQPFTFTNITVTRAADSCGLNTAVLTARIK
jgi:hypothetical protein